MMSEKKEKQMSKGKKRSYQTPEISEEEVFERGVLIVSNKTPSDATSSCINNPVAS